MSHSDWDGQKWMTVEIYYTETFKIEAITKHIACTGKSWRFSSCVSKDRDIPKKMFL